MHIRFQPRGVRFGFLPLYFLLVFTGTIATLVVQNFRRTSTAQGTQRMESSNPMTWLDAMRDTVSSYRRMIDATVEQLTDAELFARPAPGINSVAVILRHLGGNLQSRWTDFMTTDGEKPDRNRDTEFLDWNAMPNPLVNNSNPYGWPP